jgi:N-terminal domain of oxidoreductase
MTDQTLVRIVLASRPEGAPVPENFRLERAAIPTPEDGEVLLKVRYLSLDPYMRGRMSAAKSYAPPVEVGGVMGGGTVASTESSIIVRRTSPNNWPTPARTASTSISKTPAARCGTRSFHCSIPLRASPSAA